MGSSTHGPSELGNMFGGYDCHCGELWLDSFGDGRCMAGGRDGEPIAEGQTSETPGCLRPSLPRFTSRRPGPQ